MGINCQSCEHSTYKLCVQIPDGALSEEFIAKVEDTFNSPISAISKDDDETSFTSYTVKTVNGNELNNVQFIIDYECELKLKSNTYECQRNFKPKRAPKEINTVYVRKVNAVNAITKDPRNAFSPLQQAR